MPSLSPILDVIIGLAGVYVAFSLLASFINEWIAAKLQVRSTMLISGLRRIFNGDLSKLNEFTKDPMFQVLKEVSPKAKASDPAPKLLNPSYMSAPQFSAILMNLLKRQPNGPQVADLIPAAGAAIVTGKAGSMARVSNFVDGVQQAAKNLGLEDQMNALLIKSEGDVNKFVKSVEDWYDDHMDRVSGWYKRWSQRMLLGIGLTLAIVFNVDTIRLYHGLSCNQALRAAVSTVAASQKSGTPDADFVKQLLAALPLGWPQHPFEEIACASAPAAAGANGAAGAAVVAEAAATPVWQLFLLKVVGILLTAVALSLGAPFWFDTLSTLTRVRNTGKKPDAPKQT